MKVKAIMMKKKAKDAKQGLGEVENYATRVEKEFKKRCTDTLSKNIVHSVVKLGEVGSHLTLMHRKLESTCMGEAQAIANTKTKITELERNHEAAIKELKDEANIQIQWFWKELNLA